MNKKVVVYSLIAMLCLVLMFTVDWLFIIPAVYLVWLNQKELMKPTKAEKKSRKPFIYHTLKGVVCS